MRDTADYTFYLFNRIAPTLGQAGRIFYSEELGVRRVQLNAFTRRRASGSAISWRPGWPGIWPLKLRNGTKSPSGMVSSRFPGSLRTISAFSPEDLYSNLLGARLAINVILSGHGGSVEAYNQAMDVALKQALTRLLVATRGETEAMFQRIDGDWWNSHRRVPDKFLVLKRNYDLQENRLPTPIPFETLPPYRLTMPAQVGGIPLTRSRRTADLPRARYAGAAGSRALLWRRSVFRGWRIAPGRRMKTQLARIENSVKGSGTSA